MRQSSYWEYEQARLNFWHQCNSDFHKAGVEPESAADFFQVMLFKKLGRLYEFAMQLLVINGGGTDAQGQHLASVTAMEKSLLLALALKWRQQSDNLNTEQIQELEREIWLSHIHSAVGEIDKSVCVYRLSYVRIVMQVYACCLSHNLALLILLYPSSLKWTTLLHSCSLSRDILRCSLLSLLLHNNSTCVADSSQN